MSEHLLLAAGNDGTRWVILLRDYAGTWNVFSTGAGSLEARVAFLIETMKAHPGADLTFSARPLAEVQASGLIEDAAAVRTAVPGASLFIMAPAGPGFDPNLWATAWRDPRGYLSVGSRETRFRQPVLVETVREWFAKQDYRSFRPEHPRERGDLRRIARPGFARELLVRHDWTIDALMAEAPASPAAASA